MHKEKLQPKLKAAISQSKFQRFVMGAAPHINEWAIIYVMLCYTTYAIANLLWMKLPGDTYPFAMVAIGLFWLAIRGLLNRMTP